MVYEKLAVGLFVVRYSRDSELDPEQQGALVGEVKRIGAGQKVAIVFVLAEQVWTIDPKVPAFWLGVTGDRGVHLAAVAVCSASIAVRMAASGFAIANTLRGLETSVKSFTDEAPAVAWARGQLS
ncbi:MAG: hypothetical protein ACYC8T_31970 [Myxococcaceae bacterium]